MEKLRFKQDDGTDYPEWEDTRMGQLGQMVGGGTPSTADSSLWCGNTLWLTPGEMNQKYISSSQRTITEEGLRQSSARLLPKGTVVITTRATLGKMAILAEEASTNQGFQNLIPDTRVTGSEFVYYMQHLVEDYCRKMASGSTFAEISKTQFAKMPVSLPSLPEQERIAGFLSALDERVGAQRALVSALAREKQGYLRALLNQELRFKDENGDEYPEWEEKTLGEVSDCLDSSRVPLSSKERESLAGEVPYYGANNIQGYVNSYIFDEPLVLLAEDGADFNGYRNSPIAQYVTGKSWVNNHAHVLRGSGALTLFLFYALVHRDIRKFVNGTGRMKLNQSDMKKIPVPIPSLDEQEKITTFLHLLDERLKAEKAKLDALELEKKAFAQRVFL